MLEGALWTCASLLRVSPLPRAVLVLTTRLGRSARFVNKMKDSPLAAGSAALVTFGEGWAEEQESRTKRRHAWKTVAWWEPQNRVSLWAQVRCSCYSPRYHVLHAGLLPGSLSPMGNESHQYGFMSLGRNCVLLLGYHVALAVSFADWQAG